MRELLAVRSAAPLWAAMMMSLYAAGDRPWPESLRRVHSCMPKEIAAETGLLPRPDEPILREWFLPGTEPVANASELYENGVLRLPAEYHAWCAGPQNVLGAAAQPRC